MEYDVQINNVHTLSCQLLTEQAKGFYVLLAFNYEEFCVVYETDGNLPKVLKKFDCFLCDSMRYNSSLTVARGFIAGDIRFTEICSVPKGSSPQQWFDLLHFLYSTKPVKRMAYTNKFNLKFEADGYRCYALMEYVPRSRQNIPNGLERCQNSVYSFKDGRNPDLWASMFALAIRKIPEYRNLIHKPCVIPLPAATDERNNKRYRKFMQTLSRLTRIENGMDYIQILVDREEHKGKSIEWEDLIQSVAFDERIKGKHVLLLDDVLTHGTAFLNFADVITACGAKSVTGIFVAKTIRFGSDGEIIPITKYKHKCFNENNLTTAELLDDCDEPMFDY